MRIGYAHADSLLTYPDADNLSTSSQPIRLGYRLSGVKQCCETCWQRGLTVGEGGSFGASVWHAIRGGSDRCVSTSMARVDQQQCHRFHAGAAYREARARQEKSCGAGLINRRVNRRVSRQPGQPPAGSAASRVSRQPGQQPAGSAASPISYSPDQ